MSNKYEDLQKNSATGVLAQAYHANGVCGSKESKVGTFLTAYWKEHVSDSKIKNPVPPVPAGAPAAPVTYTYNNTKFLKMLKRCIQLRTRSLHTLYQSERISLLRDVINGASNELERYHDFRYRVLSSTIKDVTVEFEDGNTMTILRNVSNKYIQDAANIFSMGKIPLYLKNGPPYGQVSPDLANPNPNAYPRTMKLLVAIAYAEDGDDGNLRYNDAITKDLTHIRELNNTKRLYLMVKYLAPSTISKFSDFDVTKLKPTRPKWATRLSSQKNYMPELSQMLLRLIEIRKEAVQGQTSRNDSERREQLWEIHRHLQTLMNQRGFGVHLFFPGPPSRSYTLSTISYPYYTRRTFNDKLNNDHVFQAIFQAEPEAGIQYWNEELRWKRACEKPYKDDELVRDIHSEYYNSHVPPGNDILLSGDTFYANMDNSTTPDAATRNDHARVLPQMARAMMLQMDLFSDDTWNDMRKDYPDDFDPNWLNKCESVANVDNTPMFARATNDRYDTPAILDYPKISAAQHTLYRDCSRWIRHLDKCDAKLQNVLRFTFSFFRALVNKGTSQPASYLPAALNPTNAKFYLNAIREPNHSNNGWLLRLPSGSLLKFKSSAAGSVNSGETIIDHIIQNSRFPKVEGDPGFPGDWSIRDILIAVNGLSAAHSCAPLKAQARYLEELIRRMRGNAADIAALPANDSRNTNIPSLTNLMSSYIRLRLRELRDAALRNYNNFVKANPPGTVVPQQLDDAKTQTDANFVGFDPNAVATHPHPVGTPVHTGFEHLRKMITLVSEWDRRELEELIDGIYTPPNIAPAGAGN